MKLSDYPLEIPRVASEDLLLQELDLQLQRPSHLNMDLLSEVLGRDQNITDNQRQWSPELLALSKYILKVLIQDGFSMDIWEDIDHMADLTPLKLVNIAEASYHVLVLNRTAIVENMISTQIEANSTGLTEFLKTMDVNSDQLYAIKQSGLTKADATIVTAIDNGKIFEYLKELPPTELTVESMLRHSNIDTVFSSRFFDFIELYLDDSFISTLLDSVSSDKEESSHIRMNILKQMVV